MNNLNGTAARTYITGSTFGRSRFKEYQWNLTKTRLLEDYSRKLWDYFETAWEYLETTWTLQEDCSGITRELSSLLNVGGHLRTTWGLLVDYLHTTWGLVLEVSYLGSLED